MKRFLGLVIKTAKEERHHDQLLGIALKANQEAQAKRREAERLLVLLSEPLKDWDLADFPEWALSPHPFTLTVSVSTEDQRHLTNVIRAYQLTASAVAPLRATRVVDDQARQRGWDDQPLTRETWTDGTPYNPDGDPFP